VHSLYNKQLYIPCKEFFEGKLDLLSINTTFITLIPNKDNLECVDDYWHISFVSLALKFITKIQTNKL
jgi:hypothetical protein